MKFNGDKFKGLVSGDRTLASELLRLFASDRVLLMEQILEGCRANSAYQVEKAAHRLKGNLRNFYAELPASLAGQIEERARQGSLEGVPELVGRLEPELNQLLVELSAFIVTEMT